MKDIWKALDRHVTDMRSRPILALFDDADRMADFSARAGDIHLDFSKTNLDRSALDLLLALAEGADVAGRREAMFAGEAINITEGRPALHVALRQEKGALSLAGQDIFPGIRETRQRMAGFADDVRGGRITGQGGPVTDIVNIGIGGSDLGPAMARAALAPYADGPRCHFVSNIDGAQIHDTLAGLNPETTLLILASKTFTTLETMTNARTALRWMGARVADPMAQVVAVTAAPERAAQFGIAPAHVFPFEEWVGGRFSVWGAIGLSLMIAIGPRHFMAFLAGAADMDDHFCTAPLARNLPILLALTGIWHAQVCGYATRAVLPYDQRLARLPAYLQQLEMESNGKRVTLSGLPVAQPTVPVVWGEPGTNGQHAFFQMLHQGTQIVPCEFLVAARGHEPELEEHHRLLVSAALAQARALMLGRTLDAARAEVAQAGVPEADLNRQARHRECPGNRPSVILLYPQLTPGVLGQIIALYEHRVFVEAAILDINPFDQWGVELGKALAREIMPVLETGVGGAQLDPSTQRMIGILRKL
ncbi:glucose-6-phosphate isomerase [Rhodovulum imhoffii]|uniref:glucose-6-phosphate isomerase n=1 Tax=Rhodovulum imhoffii TaxID=365340 RepID=UPI000D363FA9|nr:glucose-6-phosphate isomerase [Rhodovulum imhoffii]MBK5934332.1 glucose-6-phosphate isomerase [Rhodovulum imhoffii]